jgi:hypothetical protein
VAGSIPLGPLCRQVLAALLGLVALTGCGNRGQDFVGNRALDNCNASWPVCSSVVGCVMGSSNYIQGHFPGTPSFIVQIAEPSTVAISVFVKNVSVSGNETGISWYEGGCRQRIRQSSTGQDFVAETEKLGFYERDANLLDTGDHLIAVDSDSVADYFILVDAVPKRLVGQ